tara:strand:+ start:10234 stop:10923 length:690 start_codon:yes stop_codon:yes gene_type:complete
MMQRVLTTSKHALLEQNKSHEEKIIKQKKDTLAQAINDEYPNIALEKKMHMDKLFSCKDALEQSYLKSPSKLFEKMVLWPFVSRMKLRESINATGRLFFAVSVFYLILTFLPSIVTPLRNISIFARFSSNYDALNITLTLFLLFFMNISLYYFQIMRMQRCIKKNKTLINGASSRYKEEEERLMNSYNSYRIGNMYTNSHGYTGEQRPNRNPLRQHFDYSTHPGASGIF